MHEPYKGDDISCKSTFSVKMSWPSKIESYLKVNAGIYLAAPFVT